MFKPFEEITEADERHANFVTPDSQRVTLAHHHGDVATITLSGLAPEGVRVFFDRARNAYLYTWFDYDLGGAAELLAFGALEQALKVYFNVRPDDRSGLGKLYQQAVAAGLFPTDPPPPAMSTAMLVAHVRNTWAHGSEHIHTPSMVINMLQMCADRINTLFPEPAA